ncbi:MAG: hypothetical protein ACYCZZ_03210 [Minisyncoccota bacterium]
MRTHKIIYPGVTLGALSPKHARQQGFLNWSLQQMQNQEDVYQNHGLATGLYVALRRLGVRRAYAPQVAPASATIVDAAALQDRIRLRGNVSLYRGKDVPADGVFLKQNEAFVMSSAGCPVIIASVDDHMIVAHAGRDSLIDRGAVMGTPTRKHVSVVDAIIDAFKQKSAAIHRMTMCMQFSISAEAFEHRFDHPQHGAYNRALAAFIDAKWPGSALRKTADGLLLNLESVFIEQARQAGIRNVWTFLSLNECPELAHTRDGKKPDRRNLILVKRNE